MDSIFDKVKEFAEEHIKVSCLTGVEERPSCWENKRVFIPTFSRTVFIGDFVLVVDSEGVRFSTDDEVDEYHRKIEIHSRSRKE